MNRTEQLNMVRPEIYKAQFLAGDLVTELGAMGLKGALEECRDKKTAGKLVNEIVEVRVILRKLETQLNRIKRNSREAGLIFTE